MISIGGAFAYCHWMPPSPDVWRSQPGGDRDALAVWGANAALFIVVIAFAGLIYAIPPPAHWWTTGQKVQARPRAPRDLNRVAGTRIVKEVAAVPRHRDQGPDAGRQVHQELGTAAKMKAATQAALDREPERRGARRRRRITEKILGAAGGPTWPRPITLRH
jgi:hypothetical protein